MRNEIGYYFDPESHFRLQATSFIDNGKEYYFNLYGQMLSDSNYAGSYYREDGVKQGNAITGKFEQRTKVSVKGILGEIDISEAKQLIQDGKIKAKLVEAIL